MCVLQGLLEPMMQTGLSETLVTALAQVGGEGGGGRYVGHSLTWGGGRGLGGLGVWGVGVHCSGFTLNPPTPLHL